MKITVCRLHNARDGFAADWDCLAEHVRTQGSEIVLLPEMPFAAWFPASRHFDARTWDQAVAAHDEWQSRLSALAPAVALGTSPVNFGELAPDGQTVAITSASGPIVTADVTVIIDAPDPLREVAPWNLS